MPKKLYWKSLKLRDGKICSDHDGSEWKVGEWRINPYPVVTECFGLNCSSHIGDAMGYVKCEVLARVEIKGTAISGDDKITAQEMRIAKAWEWEKKDSVAMAIYAAELVIGNPKEANATYAAAVAAYAFAAYAAAAAYANAPSAATYAAAATAAYAAAANAPYAYAFAAANAYAAATYAAANASAAATYAAANAAKEDREKAREEMKTKIDKWVSHHLKTVKQIL